MDLRFARMHKQLHTASFDRSNRLGAQSQLANALQGKYWAGLGLFSVLVGFQASLAFTAPMTPMQLAAARASEFWQF
jgi:hypothetical protein